MAECTRLSRQICQSLDSFYLNSSFYKGYTSHNDETYLSLCHFLGKQDSPSTADKDCKKSIGDIEGAVEKGANRKGGATDPNFLSLAVPRLSVCADAQKVDRAKLAQTEVTLRI